MSLVLDCGLGLQECGANSAEVNVIGEGNPNRLTFHIGQATMLASLSQQSKPKFSGKAHEWQQFGREWEQFMRLQDSLGDTPDETKLALLKTCLDETTQKDLQRRMELNPRITYRECWKELAKVFGEDSALQDRKNWEQLRGPNCNPRLASEELRRFWIEYQLLRDRVQDWSASEERNLILSKLPLWARENHKEGVDKELKTKLCGC